MAGTISSSGHVWILREAVEKLKGPNKLPDLLKALNQRGTVTANAPFVYARVFPDATGRHDQRRVQIGAGKELVASTSVLVNANPEAEDAEPEADVAPLSHLNEPALLRLVERRYAKKQIYTRAGPVLVAMNPFESMEESLYGPDQLALYQGSRPIVPPPPHVFEVAWSAYDALRGLVRGKEGPQSIVINGESGAGKTETAKLITRYLTSAAAGDDAVGAAVKQSLNASAPVLEAFGNAKTVRNDNSSRFGKLMKLHFTADGALCGGVIEHYLLEKTRLVYHAAGERSFHALYQRCTRPGAAAEADGAADAPALSHEAASFAILRGDAMEARGIDDAADYAEVCTKLGELLEAGGEAAKALLGGEGVEALWACVDGLLHLGNVEFGAEESEEGMSPMPMGRGGGEAAAIEPGEAMASYEAFLAAAAAWKVQPDELEEALLTFTRSAGTEERTERNTIEQALQARDALAKATYQRLFTTVVELSNAALAATAAAASKGGAAAAAAADKEGARRFIGLLDIFGMEHFALNGLEQLLINFANEKLQALFIDEAVTRTQAEFKYEGVAFDESAFKSNAGVVELIDGKVSVLSVLNSQSVSNTTPDDARLVQELHNIFGGGKHADYATPLTAAATQFTIRHFAADVTYTCAATAGAEGFVSKNKDTLLPKLPALMRTSESPFLAQLFPAEAAAAAGKAQAQSRPPVAQQFRASVASLVQTLEATVQHFIRCVKPNEAKAAFGFEPPTVRAQLLNCSVLAAAEVSRAGYPYRATFFDMLDQFDDLMSAAERKLMFHGSDVSRQELVRKLMGDAGFEVGSYAIGRSKVFGSAGLEAELAERTAALRSRRAEDAQLRKLKREEMDAEQRVRMAQLEEEAAAAAEAAISAERERTEEAQQRAAEARQRAADAERAAAAEKAAMEERLKSEKATMEAEAARVAGEAAEREAARAVELDRKRAAHEEQTRLAEEKAAAAEARAAAAAAAAEAAGQASEKQAEASRQLAEARAAEAAAAASRAEASEAARVDATQQAADEQSRRHAAEEEARAATAAAAAEREVAAVAALEAKEKLAQTVREEEEKAVERAAGAAEAARLQAEAAAKRAEAYAASRHQQELEMAEAERVKQVEFEREEREKVQAEAKELLHQSVAEKSRAEALEQQLARLQAQHAAEMAEVQAQLDEQRQLLVSTQEERDFHRDGKLELRDQNAEAQRLAAAELVEMEGRMEETTAGLAMADAEALIERARLFAALQPAIERVRARKSSLFSSMSSISRGSISGSLSFARGGKESRDKDKEEKKSTKEQDEKREKKEEKQEYWWDVIKDATGGGAMAKKMNGAESAPPTPRGGKDGGASAPPTPRGGRLGSITGSVSRGGGGGGVDASVSISHDLEFLPPDRGAEVVELADPRTGEVVGAIALSKPAGDEPAQAIAEAAKKWVDELAHLGGLLDHLPEHFAWRANQCNFAAKVAKEEGDDARDRLRTLQAREFFRAAAEGGEGRQKGMYLISANNMTRRLDVGLAIVEYQRLLSLEEMSPLQKALFDALGKAQAMEVAELQRAKGDEKPLALAHSDPRGWRRVPGLGPFALEPINFGAIHFQKEGCRYSLNLTGELVGHLHGKGLASRGYLTPAQPLLMEPHDRRLANIPLEATHFAWAFPLSGVADVADRDALTPKTREGAFALFGGFVYLSANSMVIAVNALAKARRGLCFDGPFPLLPDASKGGADQLDVLAAAPAAAAAAPLKDGAALRSVLLKEARANHATIGDLLSIGVRNFAWLGPGESRGAENGSAWPHGAFIYLYDESRADLDCYFTLKESVRNDLSRTMGSPMRSMAAYATSNRLDMGLGTSNTSVEALGLGRSRQISMPMEKGRSISSGDLKARGA